MDKEYIRNRHLLILSGFSILFLLGCGLSSAQTLLTPSPTRTPPPTWPAKDLVSILNYYATATAEAKNALPTSQISIGTTLPTGAPTAQAMLTLTPDPSQVQSAATPQPTIDWRHTPILGPIIVHFENLGDNPFLVAILASLLTLTIAFFKRILEWIGKALAWLWARIQLRGKYYEFEKEYLDWLIDQHRHLGMLPAQVVVRRWGERQHLVDLEDVFVHLSVSTQSADRMETNPRDRSSWSNVPFLVRFSRSYLRRFLEFTGIDELKIGGRNIIDPWYLYETPVETSEPSMIIERNRQIVLRGDPGSGKTTLMRYLAVTCARSLRNNQKDGDRRDLVLERLNWTKRPFPILIKLSKYGSVMNWGSERGLLDAFGDELPLELRKHCPPDFFERQLKERPCLILLDAFDELGSPSARSEMARRVNGFLEFYNKPMHRIVVTTRIVGYEGQLNRYGFQIRTIQPLQDGDVRALIKLRYRAIGTSESIGRNDIETRSIERRVFDRAQSLIARIETTPQLRQLAANPMLLSLIVLVHFLKVELPEERLLLYRDCVEILTERWQQYKWEEAGLIVQTASSEALTLTQKLVLLREMAYAMQKRKDEKNSQALIRRHEAIMIIAQRLPELITVSASGKKNVKQAEYLRYAEGWVTGIQETSGILVEQGLDEDGEPLIGFSHLTFQEYLAAVALHEVPEYQNELWSNLLNPSWREVILLYVVLTNDATSVIRALIDSKAQPDAYLLAGSCLAEKVRKVDQDAQATVYQKLKQLFIQKEAELPEKVGLILGKLLTSQVTEFLIQQLQTEDWRIVSAAVKALGDMKSDSSTIEGTRKALLTLLEKEAPVEIKISVRESLAKIGDPRFIHLNPILVRIPSLSFKEVKPYKNPFRYTHIVIPAKSGGTGFEADWTNLFLNMFRNIDVFLYIAGRKLLGSQNYVDAFAISKHPITNMEYKRFVDETGYSEPDNWTEGTFPLEKSTYPVCGLGAWDALEYCAWLSRKTGHNYRLPKEWEWEIAVGGPGIERYPWGDESLPQMENMRETNMDELLPVGTFYTVKSLFGVQDTWKGVREPTFSASILSTFNWILKVALIWLCVFGFPMFISLMAGYTYSIFMIPSIINQVLTFGFAQTWALLPKDESVLVLGMALLLQVEAVLLLLPDYIRTITGQFIGGMQVFRSKPKAFVMSKYWPYWVYHGGAWEDSHQDRIVYYRQKNTGTLQHTFGFRVVMDLKGK